jgi:hypothetical protein
MLLQYFNFKKKNLAKKTWVMGKNAIAETWNKATMERESGQENCNKVEAMLHVKISLSHHGVPNNVGGPFSNSLFITIIIIKIIGLMHF